MMFLWNYIPLSEHRKDAPLWAPLQWQASVPLGFSLVLLFLTSDGCCVGFRTHTRKLHTTLHIHASRSLAHKVHLHRGYLMLQGASRSVCPNKAGREKKKKEDRRGNNLLRPTWQEFRIKNRRLNGRTNHSHGEAICSDKKRKTTASVCKHLRASLWIALCLCVFIKRERK